MSGSIVRLMSLSESDFFRILPVALGSSEYVVEPGVVRVSQGEGAVELYLSAEPPRKIASLIFPVLRVEIACRGMSAQQVQFFLEHFDRAFHRGGG